MAGDNDNIQLDEMMRNLKRGEARKQAVDVGEGNGKQVIRADGSKAIKVRTKKRRSVQPKKELEKKSVRRKVILIAAAVSLLLLSVIGFTVMLGYYNGGRFKATIKDSIVNIAGANVELGNLDVSPSSSDLSKIDLTWNASNSVIRSLKLNGVVADCGVLDFIVGGLGGSAVGAKEGTMELAMSDQNASFNTSSERPFDYPFTLYQCSVFNIDFGDDSLWKFTNGSLSYRPAEEAGDLSGQFSLDRGDFTVPNFGEFRVRNGLMTFGSQEAEIYLGLENLEFDGEVNLDGTTGYKEGSTMDFKTEFRNYNLKGLLEPKARRFFHGEVESGEGLFKMKLGDENSFLMTSDLVMQSVRLSDFPFIDTLTEFVEDDLYSSPSFSDKCHLTITRTSSVTEYKNIYFKQEGFMSLKGDLSIDSVNMISGTIKLGLPITVKAGKNKELFKSVFTEEDGEFIWMTLTLSGDLSEPKDDLREQLEIVKPQTDEGAFDKLYSE